MPDDVAVDFTLAEAIESVFPLSAENAILVWNHVHIPLGYKYDVSDISLDVLTMLERLLDEDSGQFFIDWSSSCLHAQWEFSLRGSELGVVARDWRSAGGGTEVLLRGRELVEMDRLAFACEWKKVLETVANALERGGYRPTTLPELARLRSVIRRLPRRGRLYR